MIRLLMSFLFSTRDRRYLLNVTGIWVGLVLALCTLPASAQVLLTGATKVAVWDQHSCVVMASGSVKCWGRGTEGQLGNGSTSTRLIAVDVASLSNAVSVVVGHMHTCALTVDGGVKCWGHNQYYGALGNNSYDNSSLPVDVVGLASGVIALAAGANFSCALTTSGGVKCWGDGGGGKLGNGSSSTSPVPVDVTGLSTGVVAITTAEEHACALTNQGAVKCWGRASYGALGNGNIWPSFIASPVNVVGLGSGVVSIRAGLRHTCAVLANGEVKCWGGNSYGQIGDSTTTDQLVPVTASVVTSGFTALSLGDTSSCLLTDTGGVKCWGGSVNGTGNTLLGVAGLEAGVANFDTRRSHSCAVLADAGRVVCWGSGFSGVLGNNRTTGSSTPVSVIQAVVPASPTLVTATPYNTYAIISFTPPVNVENEPVTSYRVISEPYAPLEDVTGVMATKRQIRGLINGVNYTFRVVANNIAGQSLPSEPSNPIVPMPHYVPLPTGCSLTGELLTGVTLSSDLGEGDCPSSTQTPSFKREIFSFNAVPGDQVAFSLQAGYSLSVSVYNPYRMPVRYGEGVYYGRYPSEGYITIPAGLSGAYSIEVSNSALYAPTGPYTITLLRNPSAASSSVQASSSSSVLASSRSSVSSLINASSIVSSFSAFSSAVISSSVASENTTSSVDSSMSSVGSSASSIGMSSIGASLSSSDISSVSSSQISSAISSASSSVVASGCASPISVVFGVTTAGSLASGDCANGQRGASYFTDRYSFTATSGQQISILLSSTAIDSYVYLKNPSGVVVASDDDSGGGRNSRIPASGTYTIPAGVTGTYVIEVTSYSTLQTGAYSLVVTSAASSIASSSAASSVASSSSNSTVTNACNTSIASVLNVTNNGTLAATDCNAGAGGAGYYTDRYTFTATAGQLVAIQLSASAFDTYLYLRNSSGATIASNDDGGGGTNSRIPASSGLFAIPAAGTYVVEVTSYSMGGAGAYTLLRSQ